MHRIGAEMKLLHLNLFSATLTYFEIVYFVVDGGSNLGGCNELIEKEDKIEFGSQLILRQACVFYTNHSLTILFLKLAVKLSKKLTRYKNLKLDLLKLPLKIQNQLYIDESH